ncbi:SRPBCC domain-containing protein [Blastopirellula sp. JC732]|uniref:SRPBCC domain-containing protein n=1 Tax=Blastopirellula sediminis TaxID=2894196 RepID=A0A9X1SJM9_9BACT|nr:SRPBCC domain-containing protein [Blastopirellula sediminis]MCC9604530.1 SRPBCC domain-containing protein [Blastopirellula sediminis]MCC9632171.1 SRPBCC domain-containing protein [Blastopirellula sediminis]
MVAVNNSEAVRVLHIYLETEIAAPIDIAWEAMLAEMGPECVLPNSDDTPFPMVLEAWPGGRWYRDLGNDAGHLWGHVQVIKPSKLLEICGPLFMSYAVTNHLQYRLIEEDGVTTMQMTHRGLGQIAQEVFDGANAGWGSRNQRIKDHAERLARQRN